MKILKALEYNQETFNSHQEFSILNTIRQIGKVTLSIPGGYRCCQPDEIIYIRSEGNYSETYFIDGTKMLLSKTLKSMEEYLPERLFFRVHRSFIVNAAHIVSIHLNVDESYIKLFGDISIPISREKRKLFTVGDA